MAFARLIADGARALSPPYNFLDALRFAWVADPDDNAIQLCQRRALSAR